MHHRPSVTEPANRAADLARADPLQQVCAEVASAIRRTWGRGPTKTTAHWVGPSTLVLLLEDAHTDHEKALRGAGYIQQLREGRRVLYEILEDEFKEIVQTATNREVLTTLGATGLDPNLSALIFLLATGQPRPDAQPILARAKRARLQAEEGADEAHALEAQAAQTLRKSESLRGGANPGTTTSR